MDENFRSAEISARFECDPKVLGEDDEVVFEDVKLVNKYEDMENPREETLKKDDDSDEEYLETKYEDKEYVEQFEDQDSVQVAHQIQVNSYIWVGTWYFAAKFEKGGWFLIFEWDLIHADDN